MDQALTSSSVSWASGFNLFMARQIAKKIKKPAYSSSPRSVSGQKLKTPTIKAVGTIAKASSSCQIEKAKRRAKPPMITAAINRTFGSMLFNISVILGI